MDNERLRNLTKEISEVLARYDVNYQLFSVNITVTHEYWEAVKHQLYSNVPIPFVGEITELIDKGVINLIRPEKMSKTDDKQVTTKTDLLEHIQDDWDAINRLLYSLTPEQLIEIKNSDGWAVKDHIAHLTAWEQSVIAFLTHTPRHEGLGVPEDVYLSEDLDAINAVIFQLHKDMPLDVIQQRFRATHTQLMWRIMALEDADMLKSYRHFLPDEPGEGDGPPAINVIYGNTAHHYRTHQAWIEAMLANV